MYRPTNTFRLLSVLAAAAIVAGCTSDPAPEPATGASSGSVAPSSGSTDSSDSADTSDGFDNSGSADSSDDAGASSGAGSSDDVGVPAASGSADGSAVVADRVEPVGQASCLALPAVTAAGDVPKWEKNDPASGSVDEHVAFGSTLTWKGGVSVQVAKPKKYTPTAAEKKDITERNSSREGADKMRDYISIDVTVTNNSGGALSLPVSEALRSAGTSVISGDGWLFDEWPPLMLADGEQTTITRTAAVPDAKTVQYQVTPYDDARDRTFDANATLDRSSPIGDFEPDPAAAFGKETTVGDVTISLSAPAPFTPSAAAVPVSAAGFLAGTATVTNSSDEPISLNDITIDLITDNQSCGQVTDPALRIGATEGSALAPGESRTVAYGFAAASATAGDPVRAAVTVVEGDDGDDGHDKARGLFTGEIGTEATADPGAAGADPLAGAIGYSSGSGEGVVAFGKPASWTDSTQVIVEKPKKTADGVEISFLAQGTNAEAIAENSVVTVLTGDNGFGIAGGEVDKNGRGYHWSATVTEDGFPGLSLAELPKATIVVAPLGHLPVIAAVKKPAKPLTFAEPGAAQEKSVATVAFGETHEYADGIGVTVDVVEQQSGHGDTDDADPLEIPRIRVTNSSDSAYLLRPQFLAIQDGVAVPGGFHHDAASPLVPAVAAVIPAGAAVDVFYTSAEPVEALIVSPDPGRPPVIASR